MVKLFTYTLLAIVTALVVTLYLDIPNDPGYLLIAWRNYTFETSLFALVVLLVALLAAGRLVFMLLSWVNPWHLVRYGRRYREIRQSKARSRTVEGLMYFVRSNWQSSYKELSRSFHDDDASVINYLAAAYAAFAMHRKDLWEECLNNAARIYPGSLSTINSLRAELLFRSNQLEQSLVVLEQLKKTSINDRHLLRLLKDVYIKLEDWGKLRDIWPALKSNEVVNADELDRIDKRLFIEELHVLVEEVGKNNKPEGSHLLSLQKKWKKAPQNFKRDEKLVSYYVGLLLDVSAKKEAARAIEAFLGNSWSDALIEKYGEVDFSDDAQQLVHAEQWLIQRSDNHVLLLALGRICMRNKLWGKGRNYFENSLRISASAEVYGELSRLTRGLGDQDASEKYFARYSELIGENLPDLPMPTAVEQEAG
ncbi:MAG: hypothetical protein JKY98_11730 [Gammaproteobacteria bacterium]|nr:hypothetical protein [Gammaproteobacteria bacterium]